MKTVRNSTDKRLRLTSSNGMFVTYIDPGETCRIPEALFRSACAQGCAPTGVDAGIDNPATAVNEARLPLLVDAINEILDEGDERKLTLAGCPKANHIKAIVGEHTAEERELAWELVKKHRALEDMN